MLWSKSSSIAVYTACNVINAVKNFNYSINNAVEQALITAYKLVEVCYTKV